VERAGDGLRAERVTYHCVRLLPSAPCLGWMTDARCWIQVTGARYGLQHSPLATHLSHLRRAEGNGLSYGLGHPILPDTLPLLLPSRPGNPQCT
jgi:hypothetical protein